MQRVSSISGFVTGGRKGYIKMEITPKCMVGHLEMEIQSKCLVETHIPKKSQLTAVKNANLSIIHSFLKLET